MPTKKSTKASQKLAQYLTTIAQPVRLEILVMFKEGELCVCDIFERLHIAQNLASHHLKVLADLRLLSSRKEGVKVIYSRNEKKITHYQSLLTNTIETYEHSSIRNRVQDVQDTARTGACCRG